MTNGEKFKEMFGVSQVDEGELYAYAWLPNHNAIEIPPEWWNAEYKEPKTGHWISVSERLPKEKVNPITEDFYEYQCTVKFGDFYDVRSYKFGRGHWWNDADLMDECVIAWMPLPEPYEEG